jgi:hypothetical protein
LRAGRAGLVMLSWSQGRLVATLALVWVAILEPVSWLTAQIPPCIVDASKYGAEYAERKECPAFHVLLIKMLARIREHLGDKDWVIADFTVVLAISTLLLWIETRNAARRQSREMRSLERAFVFVREVKLDKVHGPDGQIENFILYVVWENSGASPTKHMISYMSGRTFDREGIPADFDFPDIRATATQVPVVLGPKAAIAGGRAPIPIKAVQDIIAGQSRLFMWGWCHYNDIFEDTPRHRTEFCFEVLFYGSPFPDGTDIMWRIHDRNNGADDECIRRPTPYVRPT